MAAVLEKRNGSDEVEGHFRGGKNRATGRLLHSPEGEEEDEALGDRVDS